ncbi:hypothetical protein [Pendulispora albinea]|uniref:hypothetical protein n=1 Tax=Pendulispora albinea TaxID=2741071 RepID=UPI00374E0FCE
MTFLLGSKLAPGHAPGASTLAALEDLLLIYEQLLATLAAKGVAWVHLDDPYLVLDGDARVHAAHRRALASRRAWSRTRNPAVRAGRGRGQEHARASHHPERARKQRAVRAAALAHPDRRLLSADRRCAGSTGRMARGAAGHRGL